jgi:hypothetical protein
LLPPDNDDFAERFVIIGMTNEISASNVGATKEPEEPDHAGHPGGSSVWWKWTAPSNGQVRVWTTNSSFNTLLAIYTGVSLSTLVPVASATNGNAVTFAAEGGTEYEIAVDGYSGGNGSFTLDLRQPAVPINDDFVDALPITGFSNSVTGSNVGATLEPGEPDQLMDGGGGRLPKKFTSSVWWKWTSPASEGVLVDTTGSSLTNLLLVYTGSSVSNLTAVGIGVALETTNASVLFQATAGTEYHLAVCGVGGASGSIVLSLLENSLFLSDRLTISGVSAGTVNLNFWDSPANWNLERAPEPNGPWTDLGPISSRGGAPMANGAYSFEDSAPLPTAAFYRLMYTNNSTGGGPGK